MEGNELTRFLEQFREKYLPERHPVDIIIEVLRPAIEEIIEDFESAGEIAETNSDIEAIRNASADQAHWIAILDLVNKA